MKKNRTIYDDDSVVDAYRDGLLTQREAESVGSFDILRERLEKFPEEECVERVKVAACIEEAGATAISALPLDLLRAFGAALDALPES
jgi:hypothetical protein